MPAPINIIRSGTGWTVDVTALELSTSLTDKDFWIATTTGALASEDFTKTSSTVLTYTGVALPTNTSIRLFRLTTRDIDLLQFAEAVSDVGMNQRISQIERRLDDLLERLATFNPIAVSPSTPLDAFLTQLAATSGVGVLKRFANNTASVLPSQAFGESLLNLTDAAAARTSLDFANNQLNIGGVRIGTTANTTDTVLFNSANNARISINGGNNGIGLRATDGSTSIFSSGGVERVRFDHTSAAMITQYPLRPFTNSTTAIRFQTSTGTNVLTMDTTNNLVQLNNAVPVSDNSLRIPTTAMVQSVAANRYIEANRSTTFSIPGSAITTVVFDTEVADAANQYNPSTGQFVVTTDNAGAYTISTTVTLNSLASSAAFALAVYKNSTEYRICQETYAAGIFPVLAGSITLNLAVGDVVTVRVNAFNAGSFSTFASAASMFFTASKV